MCDQECRFDSFRRQGAVAHSVRRLWKEPPSVVTCSNGSHVLSPIVVAALPN